MMSHVDEGALHAYLDGALDEYPAAEARRIRAHLDACPECAVQLDEARATRADAQAILSLATPVVELPSIEELRAQAARRGAAAADRAPAVPTPSRVRLGWAASVLLAVGLGWTLHDGGVIPVAQGPGPGVGTLADEGAREAARLHLAASPAETDTDATVALVQGPVTTGIEDAAFVSRPDLPVAEVAVARAGRSLDSVDQESVGDGAAGVGATEASSTERVPVTLVAASASRIGFDLDGLAGGVPAQGIQLPAVRPLAPRVSVSDGVDERRGATNGVVFTSAIDRGGRGRVREVPENDKRFDDEPLQSVQGFDVVAVDNISEGVVFEGSVVTQRLEGEDMLTIFHLEPAVHPSILPPLDPELNEVRVLAETGWVIMRGPRSSAELEALLMRLFPD